MGGNSTDDNNMAYCNNMVYYNSTDESLDKT